MDANLPIARSRSRKARRFSLAAAAESRSTAIQKSNEKQSTPVSHIPRRRSGETEQSARAQHEHHDQQREQHDVARLDVEIGGPAGLDQGDADTAEERARH